jgi:hypothetical protein
MKRVFALVALGLITTVVVSSCGNGKHKPCESYGNKSGSVEHVNSEELPS